VILIFGLFFVFSAGFVLNICFVPFRIIFKSPFSFFCRPFSYCLWITPFHSLLMMIIMLDSWPHSLIRHQHIILISLFLITKHFIRLHNILKLFIKHHFCSNFRFCRSFKLCIWMVNFSLFIELLLDIMVRNLFKVIRFQFFRTESKNLVVIRSWIGSRE